jgi:hypothetical protein
MGGAGAINTTRFEEGEDETTAQGEGTDAVIPPQPQKPARVDVIFLPLSQFPPRGRRYFEDDIFVNGTTKDIAKAAGLDSSKQIRIEG